ncbi:Alpha/Beta hydrolase protein [Aspergillus granulosus]|uniref:Alpha/Beta hydrolase protein n=1 Tax=Aspergillus granulosus TaxID=176169 RepID=A0ABR4H0J9_9EURO
MPPSPLTTIYKEVNSSRISVDIYLPPQNASSDHKYPVLINIHGGAFMLGHSRMVSMPQIDDCLDRGWIIAVPNHRLCPGVDLLNGPVQDMRDLLAWIYAGHLETFLGEQAEESKYQVDLDRVMAFGTSSGGFLALALGYDVPRAPAAILDFYGAVHFTHPFWRQPLPHVKANLPPNGFDPAFLRKVYDEYPIPTTSGISLEGQQSNRPDFSRPRDAFALTQIANGTVLDAIFPATAGQLEDIDPVARVTSEFPPTFIVHGDSDRMVPVELSRRLFEVLKEKNVNCGMVEVEGEDHTFALGMEVGGRTWLTSRKGFEWLEEVIR